MQYARPTVLAIVIVARLAGSETLPQTSAFGRVLSAERLRSIGGCRRTVTGRYDAPGVSTLHYILKRLDADLVEALMAKPSRRNLGARCVRARSLRPRPQAYSPAIGRHPCLRKSSLSASPSRDWTARPWVAPSMRSWRWTALGKLLAMVTLSGPPSLERRG